MKLAEVIQRVQSLYSRGVQSKDSRLTSRHIYSALITARSVLLKQQANKNQKTNQWIYQVLPCVEMIQAPVHECPCVPNNGCVILRTKYKLPKPISGLNSLLIQSVTTLDGKVVFNDTTFEAAKYNVGAKYTSIKPNYYIRNNYLYITTLKFLKAITITGLFDDPIAAKQFPSFCKDDCADCSKCEDIMDIEFPIDNDLLRPMLQMSMEELISIFKQMDEDKNNNASDDTSTSGIVHQPNNSNN